MIDPLRIKALYEEGYGARLIAKKLGRSHRTIRDYLVRMQLPMRTAAEGQALYRARHTSRTEKEIKEARLLTFKKAALLRRHLGRGLNKWERHLVLFRQRRMK